MNIAVFSKKTTFHRGYGGLETQNQALCEGLSKRGHKVTVFSPRWDLDYEISEESGVQYIFVDCVFRMGPVFGFFGSWQKNNWLNRSLEEFEKLHQESKFDLVLSQSSSGLGVIKNKMRLNLKIISISHGTIISEYKTFLSAAGFPVDLLKVVKNTGFVIKNFFSRQREFVHGSDKVIAVSNFVKRSLLEETFTYEDKIKVIYNGVDAGKFKSEKDLSLRGTDLLFVGQIMKSKGIFDLLKLFEKKELANYQLTLVGGGEDFAQLKTAIEEKPFTKERIFLTGNISYQDLIENYFLNPRFGVFVFPTKRFEGFPMVLVEAMFSGLPVVAYNKGGVEDAIVEGETGFLVQEGDLEGLKKKTLEILNDATLRKRMGSAALRRAENNFTLNKMLDEYEKVISEVTG